MAFLNLSSLAGAAAANPSSPLATPDVRGLLGAMPDYVQGGLLGPQGVSPASAAPSPATQPAPQTQTAQLPAPPTFGHRGFLGDLLDSVFLGGAIQDTRKAEYARQLQDYQTHQMQQILGSLTPEQRAAYIANPGEFGKALAGKMFTPQTLGADQREVINGETVNGAPGANTVDQPSGAVINSIAGPTGQFLGGDIDPTTGVSKRTGVQVPVQTFQTVGPGQTGSFVAPGLPSAPPGLSALAMPPMARSGAPGGPANVAAFPSPADILSRLPGATITSALRTPQHNAAVGGVPNSFHLTGQAVDLVPPKGVSMGELAANVGAAFPTLKVINEGNHIHLQPAAGTAHVPTSLQGKSPRILSPAEAEAAGFAPGSVVEQGPDGKLSVTQAPEYGPEQKSNLRNHVLSSEEYKQAQAAMAAYRAMVANAETMTGPSAYSMLDTFARAINPGAVARPTVIETIEKNLGLPAQLVGRLDSAFGQGNLPPQVRQQIIDAVVPFAQAHWDQANALNQSNAALAKQHGFSSADVTAPLESRPTRYQIAPPGAKVVKVSSPEDAMKLAPGTLFRTPDGQIRKRR